MTGIDLPIYRAAAPEYWAAGWRGILPLPSGAKANPPDGYTGAGGIWPSYADIMAWAEDRPNANIGLRLPPDVIGIDVDTYDGKQGAATWAAAVTRWGQLPETWGATSRDPLLGSAIWLYRVPVGLRWPGQVGPDIEIIQTRHRYMVAPPSLHPTGRAYQWYPPGGIALTSEAPVPQANDLPWLPEAWVAGLTAGALAVDIGKAELSPGDVRAWLSADSAREAPCRVVFRRLERVLAELAAGGSRHDVALRALMALTHLAGEGHAGTTLAIAEIARAWLRAVTAPGVGQRSEDAARAEWGRMLSGAVAVATANGQVPGAISDPCANPFAGILPDTWTAESGATLHHLPEQGGAASVAAPSEAPPSVTPLSAPPGQGSAASVPPAWVLSEMSDAPLSVPTFGEGGVQPLAQGGDGTLAPAAEWDRHAVAVALELERLEVRRDARLELARAEHMRSWREPRGYSLRDALLMPDVPPQWRVWDVMPEGANVLLVAQYKTGKTTLINELAKSVADGDEFLGTYKIPKTVNVALFNFEVGEAQYVRWLRDRGFSSVDSVYVLNLRGFALPLTVPLVRDYVVRWLSEREIGMWIVDPFARAFTGSGDENSNADVAPFLEILDEIKERSGVTELVMPTHTGRAEFTPGAERARGATRLEDWCDVRWLLTRDDEGARYFRATGRDVETEETRLEYEPLSRAVTLGQGSRPRKSGREGNGRQAGAQSVEDAILEVLADEPGASVRQLRGEVRQRIAPVSNARIDDAVRRLTQQGRVRVEHTSQGGRPVMRHYAALLGDGT